MAEMNIDISKVIEKAIEKIQHEGYTVQRWISCADRLPMEGMDVLACNFDEFCIIARYNGECWEDDLGRIDDGITHWQELPTPPKEEA